MNTESITAGGDVQCAVSLSANVNGKGDVVVGSSPSKALKVQDGMKDEIPRPALLLPNVLQNVLSVLRILPALKPGHAVPNVPSVSRLRYEGEGSN